MCCREFDIGIVALRARNLISNFLVKKKPGIWAIPFDHKFQICPLPSSTLNIRAKMKGGGGGRYCHPALALNSRSCPPPPPPPPPLRLWISESKRGQILSSPPPPGAEGGGGRGRRSTKKQNLDQGVRNKKNLSRENENLKTTEFQKNECETLLI